MGRRRTGGYRKQRPPSAAIMAAACRSTPTAYTDDVDQVSVQRRSEIMALVPRHDTKPELAVRRALHRVGIRFRVHRRDLPGTPDIVIPRLRVTIFVHGCFWHGHEGCPKARLPSSRVEFWNGKRLSNTTRDISVATRLASMGWRVLTLWECEMPGTSTFASTIAQLAREYHASSASGE